MKYCARKMRPVFRDSLGRENVKEVKMSDRQHSQPAVVTVENLTTLRRYEIQLRDW